MLIDIFDLKLLLLSHGDCLLKKQGMQLIIHRRKYNKCIVANYTESSEVHFFIENTNGNCIDFADVRTSNPNTAIENIDTKNEFKEIEVQFKKTGRQILDVIIQPNPSDGIVYLNILENSSTLKLNVAVFNTLGQSIKTYQTNENQLLLDGIQWQKGVYIVIVSSENNTSVKKVIIN